MRVKPTSAVVEIDQHYPPSFFAALWSVDASTITRWFQDMDGVLKLSTPAKNGKRARVEIRIPLSLAMAEHARRCKSIS